MKTKDTSFFSFKSPQDRLFWFSRAGYVLFLIYFLYAAYTLVTSQNTLVHWTFSHFRTYDGPPFPIDSLSTLGGLILNTASSLLLCWWYWMVARLFRKCEKGRVFSDSTLRLLKKIAILFLFFAVVGLFNQVMLQLIYGSTAPGIPGYELSKYLAAQTNQTGNEHVTFFVTHIGFGMFGLQYNGIDLQPIAVALIFFIALGVVEEGLKIREEQQLTV